MQRNHHPFSFLILVFAIAAAVVSAAVPCQAQASQDEASLVEAARAMRNTGSVQFNFRDLDLGTFIRFMSEVLQENILIDPSVKGTVTVVSPRALSLSEARQAMLSVLEMNGLSLQRTGTYSKVVPASKGQSTDYAVRKGRVGPGFGESFVTQIVPLDYVSAQFVAEGLKAAMGGEVGVAPMASGAKVLLMGKATAIQKALGVINALDAADSLKNSRTVDIRNTTPSSLAKQLAVMAKDPSSPLSGLLAVPDDASRKLVLIGEKRVFAEAQKIIRELDIPARAGQYHVVPLKNTDAKTMAEKLSTILSTAAKLQPDQKGALPASVVADPGTNSLIFVAEDATARNIEAIIQKLDIQPKQVFIRGLIAEVNMTKLNNAGIDWATWGGAITGDAVLAGQAALGNPTGIPSEFVNWFRDLTRVEEKEYDQKGNLITTTKYEGKSLIYATINMLKKYDAINVLSMPRLLCTDNMESELQVGQVIPQLKSKLADTSNPSAVQNSYDYKDTGLILKVTPHVRSGNLVALEIDQTVEDVLTPMTVNTPTTSKRQIKSNVTVGDGQTIVLGGLIKESDKSVKSRVPILSYIPILGDFFKSVAKSREKVDLLIFLTPQILETPEEASLLTKDLANASDDVETQLTEMERTYKQKNDALYRQGVKNQ
ncbi:MAG: type II secretion system secretin GspD [Synergistaceae bacterium]|nr:type II secretion system secretin GspD [Synergistaceae bacterium]